MAAYRRRSGARPLSRRPFPVSRIVASVGGDQVTVAYADGGRETLPADRVRRFDWQAGTMVDAIWSGDGGWYAAIITGVGPDDALTVRFDGSIVERTRTEVAKSRSE